MWPNRLQTTVRWRAREVSNTLGREITVKARKNQPEFEEWTGATTLENALLILLGAALGALFAVVIAPRWLPGLAASLTGPNPKAYWYLARGSGAVAYVLLWSSVALGLMITNKLSRVWPGGPTAVDLHQFVSLLALAFALFHALVLLGDRYIGYTLFQLLVPFASTAYRPLWVGLGQLGFYLALPVAFSFYVRRRIGHRTWRFLHYGSFGVYFLVTAHGLGAGTDANAPLMIALYGLTVLITYFLLVYRLLVSVQRPRPAAQKPREMPTARQLTDLAPPSPVTVVRSPPGRGNNARSMSPNAGNGAP